MNIIKKVSTVVNDDSGREYIELEITDLETPKGDDQSDIYLSAPDARRLYELLGLALDVKGWEEKRKVTATELELGRLRGKIPMIQAYRARLKDVGLKEAKDAVEAAMTEAKMEFRPHGWAETGMHEDDVGDKDIDF